MVGWVLVTLLGLSWPAAAGQVLTFEDRVDAQSAIESVYLEYRLGRAASDETRLAREQLEHKVSTYLKQTALLERVWSHVVTQADLEQERERILTSTQMPQRLDRIREALGYDAHRFDECFVRPILVDRLSRLHFANDRRIHAAARERAASIRDRLTSGELRPDRSYPGRTVVEFVLAATEPHLDRRVSSDDVQQVLVGVEDLRRERAAGQRPAITEQRDAFIVRAALAETADRFRRADYVIPKIDWDRWWSEVSDDLDAGVVDTSGHVLERPVSSVVRGSCAGDSWGTIAGANAPSPRREPTGVWTGAEMIIWGGRDSSYLGTGGRYDPMTDSWTPTATLGAPAPRTFHTAVWTGSEMIVWGGFGGDNEATGGRYDPATDSWSATDVTTTPAGRDSHSAVWSGTEMIVWGGYLPFLASTATGGRYDPATDSWVATNFDDAPERRAFQTAIWTGSEMIIYGGLRGGAQNTGGRYDPVTDSWTDTSTTGATARDAHAAVWTGAEMLVWGGFDGTYLGSGDRYDPGTDSWSPMSNVSAPSPRTVRPAVWTGSEMLVWGGFDGTYLDTGARYRPATDSWTPMQPTGVPGGRLDFAMVWTGAEMIVWGGSSGGLPDDGGSYGLSVDNDLDGVCTEADCDDDDGQSWGAPGEAESLVFGAVDVLSWNPPSNPGGTLLAYDVIRASSPGDFVSAPTCVESDDTLDVTATDATVPASGEVFHYLVRAESGCLQGQGALGAASSGTPRTAASCP